MFFQLNPLKPPRSVAKIREGGHPRPGGELTFTPTTQSKSFQTTEYVGSL